RHTSSSLFVFSLITPRPARSTLFPYTTLFRSLWLFDRVGDGRTPIVNISGGTEVGACFLSTCVAEPIKPVALGFPALGQDMDVLDRKSTRLNSSHEWISYAVFCLKKKKINTR